MILFERLCISYYRLFNFIYFSAHYGRGIIHCAWYLICIWSALSKPAIIIKTIFFDFVIILNGKEGTHMGNQSVISIEAVIDYIESHLDGKLELETVAEAVHYSKYHLHRLFTEIVGMTIHDYVQRRQLTEAAKLLVFSDKPIIEIAFICGYES